MTNRAAASPREFLQRLLRDRRGVTAVFVALAFTMLIGFVALGVETGLWYAIKRQDQSAADAAAISGAYEVAQCQINTQNTTCPNYPDICAKARGDAVNNGFTFQSYTCPSTSPGCTNPSSGQMCANWPPVSGTLNGNDTAVEVILNRQQDTFFANLFLSNVTIGSRAVAKVNTPGFTCDLSLAKTGTGIAVQGSATIDLTGCGMAANSTDAAAISFGGGNNDVLDASWFQTVGNYNANGNPVLNVPTRLIDSTPVKDPYAPGCNPPQIGCAGQITYVWPGTPAVVPGQPIPPCFAATGNTTLQPGLYGQSNGSNCSDNKGGNGHGPPMEFASGTTTLCPGVYYLDGEDNSGNAFYVHGGTVQMGTAGATTNGVTCPSNGMNGVTIIAGSQPGGKGGGFNIVSGSNVDLSAPTARVPSGCTFGSSTGCIPSGILFYQDPTDADTGTKGNGFTGDSSVVANGTTSLQGAMYTPATNVTFSGNAGSTCFIVISLTMTYTGNSTMSGNQAACAAVGVTGPTVMNISLTE